MTAVGQAAATPAGRFDLGGAAARRLLPVQAMHSAGEALFALSLVGSLFFNVSVDAARPRILLYLAVTMAPFAVLAPLIGPIIDRLRGGHRAVLILSLAGRSLVAALLASQLKTLLLYPEAFVIVVLAKVYVVGRNALIPSLVEDRSALVVVNSMLARVGTVAGVSAAGVGVGILQLGGASWVLRTGALCYGLAALAALAIPDHDDVPDPASPVVESTEMHGPGIQTATVAMAGLRMATGFVFFHVGFALKTTGEPAWLIGLIALSASFGGFAGTFLAPRLRLRFDGQRLLTMCLVGPALIAALAALRFHPVTVTAVALSLGLAGSIGRRAFDGIVQTEAPHARRGRAYATLETRLELAWVVGSVVAVLSRAPNWLGVTMLAAALGALSVDRIVTELEAQRVGRVTNTATLPLRLLETAEAIAARGDRQQAVLLAVAAVEAAALTGNVPADRLDDLQCRARAAALDDTPGTDGNRPEDELIALAHELVTVSLE